MVLHSASDPESLGSFEILGVPAAILLDEESLRQKFYELSKQYHPDRYAQKSPTEAMAAARISTRLNRAYQEIRDLDSRIEALLSRFEKAKPAAKSNVPIELAERYFELQDLLGNEGGRGALESFRKDLASLESEVMEAITNLGQEWQDPPKDSQVAELRKLYDKRRYLVSMCADVDKKIQAGST